MNPLSHTSQLTDPRWRVCIAPMMAWTDRHFRYLMRLISPHVRLYTEMVTTGALVYGDKQRYLRFSAQEAPLALQLGGHCPKEMAQCARLAEDWGYDEVNINVGCPSNRVQSGRIGACLMAEPDLIAECVARMREQVQIPVTVKTRIGIDEQDSYAFLVDFIGKVADAGCETFIIHARKAWLKGLNPKQNRSIPVLQYDRVYQLKQDFPQLTWVINGGIQSPEEAGQHLQQVDGVMIGRSAYYDPYDWRVIDALFYGSDQLARTRVQVAEAFIAYMAQEASTGTPLWPMARHCLNLFNGVRGAKQWRRTLSQHAQQQGADLTVIEQALGVF